MSTVAIVDSGGANIASLQFALERLGSRTRLTRDPDVLTQASHVILPGVGAANDAMQRLADYALTDCLRALTQPVLGICLGMQLLARESAEDNATCLGITDDAATRLSQTAQRPVPHMGWNQLQMVSDSPLLAGIDEGSYFYFIHSYALPVSETTLARCDYGGEFSAVIQQGNFYGTQFHPERSAAAGARLLENFIGLTS